MLENFKMEEKELAFAELIKAKEPGKSRSMKLKGGQLSQFYYTHYCEKIFFLFICIFK
jgi:hypothetical protein